MHVLSIIGVATPNDSPSGDRRWDAICSQALNFRITSPLRWSRRNRCEGGADIRVCPRHGFYCLNADRISRGQAGDLSAHKLIFKGHVLHVQSRIREILRGAVIYMSCDNYCGNVGPTPSQKLSSRGVQRAQNDMYYNCHARCSPLSCRGLALSLWSLSLSKGRRVPPRPTRDLLRHRITHVRSARVDI